MKESVTIPKGVDSGINLRLTKKGNFSLKGDPGDLLIKVTVKPHHYFKRDGYDIITDKYITMTQAILGGSCKVDTISGSKMELRLKPGTAHDETIVI